MKGVLLKYLTEEEQEAEEQESSGQGAEAEGLFHSRTSLLFLFFIVTS